MPGEGPDHLRVRSFTLSLSLYHLPSSISHSPPVFCLSIPPFLISAALTLLLLSSGVLVRLHSMIAATVKRDIFHKQKITKGGVRTCAPKKASSCFANFSPKCKSLCLNVFRCHSIEFANEKSQTQKSPLTACDQLADSALLTLCD